MERLEDRKKAYNAGRLVERVSRTREGISRSGDDFRQQMASSALETLPNPGAIEKDAFYLEENGLGTEAQKLRTRYQEIQKYAKRDSETGEG